MEQIKAWGKKNKITIPVPDSNNLGGVISFGSYIFVLVDKQQDHWNVVDTIIHESVHVFQKAMEYVQETGFGTEGPAYHIASIAVNILKDFHKERQGRIIPYMTNGKRDYKKEYAKYQGRPDQIKKRSERTTARRQAEAAGIVHKGDGKDMDHIKPLSKGGKNVKSNERAVPASVNRSFSRNANGSLKSQTSKRERKR